MVILHSILFLAFVVEANAVLHHGAYGQDFEIHRNDVLKAVQTPFAWTFYPQPRTSPPLYHLLVSFIYRLCSGVHWLEVTGMATAIVNLFSLRLLYSVASEFIANSWLRLSLLTVLAFLPVTLVTSIVLSADSLSQLPFCLLLYTLVKYYRGAFGPIRAVLLVAFASLLGFSNKFIAVSFIPATLLVVPLLCHARVVSWRRGLTFLAVYIMLAAPLEYHWLAQRPQNITASFSPDLGGFARPPVKMNLRSLLFVREGDIYLLNAPSYWDLLKKDQDATRTLYNSNYFSFPGLAVFAVFTDSLNIFQAKGKAPFGSRGPANQMLMSAAVKVGAMVAALAGMAFVAFLARDLSHAVKERSGDAAVKVSIAVFALGWLGCIIALLPLATLGYLFGYWLPRLYLPAIWAIGLLAFVGLDRLLARQLRLPFFGIVIFVLAVAEATLHVAFLWPWNNY
jgi:hypothetical protein